MDRAAVLPEFSLLRFFNLKMYYDEVVTKIHEVFIPSPLRLLSTLRLHIYRWRVNH